MEAAILLNTPVAPVQPEMVLRQVTELAVVCLAYVVPLPQQR